MANPTHCVANSERVAEAFEALDLVVVIDVALTDAARHGRYSGAASRHEKPQGTYFNFEFADNTLWLLHQLIEPPPGALPQAKIWARLVRAAGLGGRARDCPPQTQLTR